MSCTFTTAVFWTGTGWKGATTLFTDSFSLLLLPAAAETWIYFYFFYQNPFAVDLRNPSNHQYIALTKLNIAKLSESSESSESIVHTPAEPLFLELDH